jgi:methyltransferase
VTWTNPDTRLFYLLLVALVGLERVVELVISRRNARRLLARGAVEFGAGHYRWMVLLHTAFLAACPLEVWLLRRPFLPVLAGSMTLLLVATMALRYWVVVSLEGRWNTRVIVLPGAPLVRTGPFRWLRHPNYAAVVLELIALPLIHSAWLSAALFGLLNALVLRARIRVEDEALCSVGGAGSVAPEEAGAALASPRGAEECS